MPLSTEGHYTLIKELIAFCSRSFPELQEMHVPLLNSISSGWESDVYAFDLEHGPPGDRHTLELILRIYPGDDAFEKSYREYHGMRKLHSAGYPLPEVFSLSRDGSVSGKPCMIMQRIDGRGMWNVLSESTEQRKMLLLDEFCGLVAELHSLEWIVLEEDRGQFSDPFCFIDEFLTRGREYISANGAGGFGPVLNWLEERRGSVPCIRPSPVHLDLHPGNVLMGKNGTNYVIDWTQVSVSDPRMDLSWTMLLMSTHMERKWRDLVLSGYRAHSDRDMDSIEYFEVISCLKRLASIWMSLESGSQSMGMRPEAVEMMKQQMVAIGRVYDVQKEITELTVPEIERMIQLHSM